MSRPDAIAADRGALHAFLASASRRLSMLAALEGAVVGFFVAMLMSLAGWPARTSTLTPFSAGLLAAVVGAITRAWLSRRARRTVARQVERAVPESRNLIVTAAEIAPAMRADESTRAYVHSIVLSRAAGLVRRLDPALLFPAQQRALILVLVAAVWIAAIGFATRGRILGPTFTATPTIDRVDVIVTPPAYVGRPAVTLRNPDRVRVLAGTRVEVQARTNATLVNVATLDSTASLPALHGAVSLSFVARGDGLITLVPSGVPGVPDAAGISRLIGISVDHDAAPTVRIAAPGRDMLVPDGRRALDIGIEAGDDIALSSLKLRYTTVSGSGERFTFKEADVPISVSRADARSWRGSARWSLDSLKLEPGDMVVYRAIAADARPGALPVESDAFIVEIATPGGVAEAGYSVDPEEDRYALSQQMVLLKSTRLLAGRARMDTASYADSARNIASEQRRVRAEFVFLMGGEMSDAGANDTSMTDINEEEDAAAQEDLAVGRQLNRGRISLLRAIRAMSLAARSLNEADMPTAITHEREAIRELEAAFARNRILLRAFSIREALDTTRRLTGELTELARAPRTVLSPDSVRLGRELRRLADQVSSSVRLQRGSAERAQAATVFAELALRIDPSSREMQAIASEFGSASTAWRRGQDALARQAVDRAMMALMIELGRTLPSPSSPGGAPRGLDARATRGALTDLQKARRP